MADEKEASELSNERRLLDEQQEGKIPRCGIIMPISAMEECSERHWLDVKMIIEQSITSIEEPRFSTALVSEALDVGVIHKRIVQNVYQCDVVVCDMSCKNPNVMFELGMRIAFDRNVVLIKDDKTDRAFDTSTIESIQYPRSLRFPEIVEFKERLAKKVSQTYAASQNADYQSILKSFGAFEVAKVEEKEVPEQILAIKELQREVSFVISNQLLLRSELSRRSKYAMNATEEGQSYNRFAAHLDRLKKQQELVDDELYFRKQTDSAFLEAVSKSPTTPSEGQGDQPQLINKLDEAPS